MRKEKYLVVIPYLASAAQGRELEYAIAGWRAHFKEPYLIVLVGEGLPYISCDDIVCVESKRVADIPGQYRQHLDYVSCFRKVHDMFPDSDGFIFVADDCYAVNDFDIADIQLLKMLEPEFVCSGNTTNTWRLDKLKTKKALLESGLPVRNFTTHLPQWYDWDRIEELWVKYDMLHSSYVMEDLYYNTYYSNRIPFRLDRERDNMKLGIYTRTPDVGELRRSLKTKIWLTNSPEGWVPELEALLKEHYKTQ